MALSAFSSVAADTEVKVSGELRFRNEFDARSFNPDAVMKNYQLLRTRLAVEALVDSNTHAFVQFQDSRTAGGYTSTGELQSGLLNDGKNVDLHQAFIQIDRLGYEGIGARLGRFEFNLGGQRVFGSVGWHNVGRSWEGVQGWYDNDDFKFSAFWLRHAENNDVEFNRDYDLIGLHTRLERANTELFGVYEIDSDTLDVMAPAVQDYEKNKLNRMSIGLYSLQKKNRFDLELNAVFQTGTQSDTIDIQAYMFAVEAGFTLPIDAKARLALGIDYATGDDDPADTEYKTYNNLYYTGHKFRGHMDYFIGSGDYGLIDMYFRSSLVPMADWLIKLDAHYFTTAQEYLVLPTVSSSDVGIEFDFSVSTVAVAGVNLSSGVSVFSPHVNYVETMGSVGDSDDFTYWIYNQAVVTF